jgi:hypothetical protein
MFDRALVHVELLVIEHVGSIGRSFTELRAVYVDVHVPRLCSGGRVKRRPLASGVAGC